MPAAAVASLAKKAGVSTKAAETAWGKIKDSVIGAKTKGGVIPADQDKWNDEMWAYVMGAFKKAVKGMGESVIDQVVAGALVERVMDSVEYGKWYADEMDRLGHEIAMQSGDLCWCDRCNGLIESRGS